LFYRVIQTSGDSASGHHALEELTMWVIRNDNLFSLPDTAALPPNSSRVDLPADFIANPRGYKIEGGKIVKAPPADAKTTAPVPMLTADEIRRVRAAIDKGLI
jgi:hypothetical protein